MLTDPELAGMRDLAAESYTATITATSPGGGGGGWDPETGPGTPTPETAAYAGPARVQAVRNSAQPRDAVGQSVTVRPYKIGLPWDAPDLPVGATVAVDSHMSDPHVVGKVLTVAGSVYGDLGIERVLYADLDLSNQPGG